MWQPISTAPKDGTRILITRLNMDKDCKPLPPEVVIGAWYGWLGPASEEWVGVNVASVGQTYSITPLALHGDFANSPLFPKLGPTHWMPLQEPQK